MIFLFWLSYFSHLSFFWDHCSIMMQDTKKCQGLNITFLDYLLSGWPIFRKESVEKCLSSIKIPFPTLEEGFSAGDCPLLPHPFGTGTVASCFEQLSVGHWANCSFGWGAFAFIDRSACALGFVPHLFSAAQGPGGEVTFPCCFFFRLLVLLSRPCTVGCSIPW